jgi:F-type H+-transporting ATPase subunit epsilon
MSSFTLQLQDATRIQRIDGVTAFVGEDASGSFGLLAGHARFMTSLVLGLARYRIADRPWQYLALPGGLLYFSDNLLILNTRHYLADDDYNRISSAMQQKLLAEEEKLHTMKSSLHSMEEEVLRRLWRLGRTGG